MKILVVNNMAPFVWGGAEELAVHLRRNLIAAGHESEVLRIPFQWEPATRIPSQILLVRALELSNVDRVIALKFPAYFIRHPRKTLWLLHQYRQAYDLFDAGQTNLPAGEDGEAIRRLIVAADQGALQESQRIYTNSQVTQSRLKKYNGFDSKVLLPPLNDPELFTGGASEGYIFAGGRINDMKRQYMLVQAMAKTPMSVRLIIGGPPDSHTDARKLEELVEHLGLQDRVKLDMCFLPRRKYAAYINAACAVAYLPFDEDSLGYVAMEAAIAGKALITSRDSGGVLGLVRPGETGWVAEPDVDSLAQAMSAASTNRVTTVRLGEGARLRWSKMGITWPRAVEALLK